MFLVSGMDSWFDYFPSSRITVSCDKVGPFKTNPLKGVSKSGVAGGTLTAKDGAPPLRAAVRCWGCTNTQPRRGKSSQSLLRPQDLRVPRLA